MSTPRQLFPHHSTTEHHGQTYTYTHSAAEYDRSTGQRLIYVATDEEAQREEARQEEAHDRRQTRRDPANL